MKINGEFKEVVKDEIEEECCDVPIAERWYFFSQETSLHGIKAMTNRGYGWPVRIFYTIVFMVALVAWLFSSVEYIMQIQEYHSRSVFKLKYRKSLDFPTLTICPACPLDTRGINVSQSVRDLFYANSIWKAVQGDLESNNISVKYQTMLELMEHTGKTINDTFLQVRWNGEYLDPLVVFKDITRQDKVCFQFNGEDYQNAYGGFVAHLGGPTGGLEIIADVGETGCPGGLFDTAGLEIYIHSPQDKQPPRAPNIVISPGAATYITLTKTETKFLPYPYKAMGNATCVDDSFSEFVNYSKISCIERCVQANLQAICRCDPSNGNFTKIAANCPGVASAISCWLGNQDKLYREAERGTLCDCPDLCFTTDYTTDISFSYFPTDATTDRLVDIGYIPNHQYARRNLLKFNMYYKSLTVAIVDYVPEYTSNEMLGTIGGQLGLFLGASLITACEIIHSVLLIVFHSIKNLIVAKSKVRSTSSQ